MTEARLRDMLRMQLTKDYNCYLEDFEQGGILITAKTRHPERRRFEDEDSIASLMVHDGKLIVTVEDELFDAVEDYFADTDDSVGEWFFDTYDFIGFNELLASFGYELGPARVGYIPRASGLVNKTEPICAVEWLDEDGIEAYRGDDRFNEALLFSEVTPDVLAVAAKNEFGGILGMAGASRNSASMWEMGVNVLDEARRRGIAANLVALLAEEAQDRGALPYFNCCMSHIAAQRTALAAGLAPAFCEMRTRRLHYESPFEDEEEFEDEPV